MQIAKSDAGVRRDDAAVAFMACLLLLIEADARRLDHLRPLRDLRCDERLEFFRRAVADLRAHVRVAFPSLRRLEYLHDSRVEPIHDRPGRAGWHEDTVPDR